MKYKVLFVTLMLMSVPMYILKAEELNKASIIVESTNEDEELVSGVDIELFDSNNKLINSKTSNSDGIVEFEDISSGTYIVKIAAVPQEYQDFKTEYQVNVVNDNQRYLVNNLLVNKSYSRISFYKKDARGKPLGGSEITIYDEENNVVEVIVTDENGFAESKPLENGIYYIQETKAPIGYNLDPKRYKIYVGSKVSGLEYTSISEPLTATKSIKVLNDAGEMINGVKFELIDSNGQKVDLTSNQNGVLSLQQLDIGDYTLRLVDNRFSSELQEYNFSVSIEGQVLNLPSQIILMERASQIIPGLAITGSMSYILVSMFIALLLVVVKKFSV